jgi:hypothetical protein
MTSALVVPNDQLVNYPPEFNKQVVAALTVASSEITALQGTGGALDWKNSVVIATTAALAANTRTGNVLLADANGLLGTIDGIDTATLTLPFRFLVKNEVTQANNGLYSVTSIGGAGAKWTATRTTDADESAEVTPNMALMVEQGTANQDKIFVLDINGPVTLNTTALVFTDWRGIAITAPADVTKAAAAVGVGVTLARADHKHDVSTAVAGASTVGASAAEGSATSLARSDHAHSLTAAAPVTIGTANAEGAASTFNRADHVHDHGAQNTATHHAVATSGANGFMSSTDKAKLDTIQGGTDTLASGTVTISTATITANSRIQITMKDFGAGAITGLAALAVPVATRTPGAPGSFVVNAVDDSKSLIATAACTFDWAVYN